MRKKLKYNYYSVGVYLFPDVRGVHIIRAKSEKNALEIRERHGISNPRFAKGNFHITCRKLNLSNEDVQKMLNRRKQGLGGSIWYENENGDLQKEL